MELEFQSERHISVTLNYYDMLKSKRQAFSDRLLAILHKAGFESLKKICRSCSAAPGSLPSERYFRILIAGYFCLLAVRAATFPIMYDEAYTYLQYVATKNLFDIDIANNHILNTILICLFDPFVVYNELIIRLPNLLIAILSIVALAAYIKKAYLGKIYLVVLYLSPLILMQIMTMARGYGLSMALNLISLIYVDRYIKEYKDTFAVYANIIIVLSVFSNLVSLFYYCSFLVIFVIYKIYGCIKNKKLYLINRLVLFIIANTIFLAFFYYWGKSITQHEDPLFRTNYFFEGIRSTFSMLYATKGMMLYIVTVAELSFFISVFRRSIYRYVPYVVLIILSFIFMLLVNMIIEKHGYPYGRQLMPYWPLLYFILIQPFYLGNDISKDSKLKSSILFPQRCLLVFFVFLFIVNIGSYFTPQDWSRSKITQPVWKKDIVYASKELWKPYDPEKCVAYEPYVEFLLRKYSIKNWAHLNICR